MLLGTIASICNFVMTIWLAKNAARGGMLNRREPPQITLHNAQEGQCNRQSNDQQDQLHGVDIFLLEQPVEQEHKAQRQNVGHDGVKDALHGNAGDDKRFGESKGYIAGDQSANDHNAQNTGSLADISG